MSKNYKLIKYDVIDSTNEEAKRLIKKGGDFDKHIILAKEQTSGKGRLGNIWDSPKGNIYCSVILKWPKDKSEITKLSILSAVMVAESLQDMLDKNVTLEYKWPNDLLLNGKKFCGILIENIIYKDIYIIIGIGINLYSFPKDTKYPATSLDQYISDKIDILEFIDKLYSNLDANIIDFKFKDFSLIREKWLNGAKYLGDNISVRLASDTIKGKFLDIDEDGQLILELDNSQKRVIIAGEIF